MRPSWSRAEFLRVAPGSTVIASDFDGTLAPIVDDPAQARPDPAAPETLVHLAARYRTVAVVSGRPASFLRESLGEAVGRTCHLIGRYGAERLGPGAPLTDALPSPETLAALAVVRREAQDQIPAARIENKGASVALHYREAPELEEAVQRLGSALATRLGLELRPGKKLVELVEPGSPDKGTALRELLLDASAGCFLGDDVGDLLAFDALDRFAESGGRVLRVTVAGLETPDELLARSDLTLASSNEAVAFLSELARD